MAFVSFSLCTFSLSERVFIPNTKYVVNVYYQLFH